MKFDIVEIQKGDVVLSTIDIGNLPPEEVDKFVGKAVEDAKSVFGCPTALLPVRGGNWDFTIIRNPNRKLQEEKKPSKKRLKKVA